jgi:cell division septum initiation protein DivIVA
MNENSDLLPNLLHEEFEMQMRGYSRRQVDDFVARRNSEIRELEQRLTRSLDESEHLRREMSTVRQQALSGRPAHEEVSERISQILKLADDEAKAQKNKADDDIAGQRADAHQESERVKADAREQAERMLTAAQEQAERTIAAARNEADKTRTAARTEADRLTSDTRKKADAALSQAKSQAKRVLDEATARASAIHDGAERRLNLLSTRHSETVRRLSDILDGVQGLVAAESTRMSLEEEVDHTVSRAVAQAEAADAAATAAANGQGDSEQDNLDLALLAPPAAETVATGAVAPPRAEDVRQGVPARPGMGAPGFGGRHSTPAQEQDDESDESDLGGLLPPTGPARGQIGRPGPVTPAPQLGAGSGRLGDADDNGQRAPIPMPSGAPSMGSLGDRGLGDRGLGDRDLGDRDHGMTDRDQGLGERGLGERGLGDRGRDPLGDRDIRRGLIDPDEPTEGIRLL